jgi:4-amino-4-deoxy-L-arabinose transferase-like glycosyltransferase
LTGEAAAVRRIDPVVLALFVLVNAVVLWNALHHHPPAGYDANAHIKYVATLAEGRLPTRSDTYEAFSPPLSYLPPALVLRGGLVDVDGAPRAAQLLNVVYSIAACWLLLHLAERLAPGSVAVKRTALFLVGMVPVYYKTFAFVRPEPLLTALTLAVLAAALDFVGARRGPKALLVFGALMGMALLSRQQAIFAVAAVTVFVLLASRGRGVAAAGRLGVALVVAFAVSGWFYLGQLRDPGGVLAYSPGLQGARDEDFFLGTGDGALFRDPVRPAFRNELLPVLYSETWGDHGCYFLVYGSQEGRPVWGTYLEEALVRRPRWLRTNRWAMGRWLGRVNVVALLPTAVLLLGAAAGAAATWSWVRGEDDRPRDRGLALLTLTALATVSGYVALLVLFYANPTGSLIKATYVLPAFPALALLAAAWLDGIRARNPRVHAALVIALILATLHNAPAFVTRYRLDAHGKMVPAAGEVGAREGGETTEATAAGEVEEPVP